MDDDDIPAVVIDSGSGSCKGGFAGDDASRTLFSSVVGQPRFPHNEIGIDHMVGDEAQTCREFLSLGYPIDRGIVTNWDDAEKVWEFCFKDLRVDSAAQPLLVSEPVLSPASQKERMAETMFETFKVPGYFAHNSATLSLFASGRGVGLILDIGEGVTHAVPMHFSYNVPQSIQCQDFGGRDVTLYLQKLLQQRGSSFTTTSELEYVREIKEEISYISLDYNKEVLEPIQDKPLILPDGNKLDIGKEMFQCGECLFQPSLAGQHGLKGLHELLQSCMDSCYIDLRRDFYCNVLLSGGCSLMNNLTERLGKLWRDMMPPGMVSHIVAKPERKFSVWIGGSIVASLSSFQKAWITKQDYEEYGPTIVHRRCL